jgi:ferredoxin
VVTGGKENIMRIVADRERCVGAGQCVLAEPGIFGQSDSDGRVVLLVRRPGREDEEALRSVLRLCPSGALSLAPE